MSLVMARGNNENDKFVCAYFVIKPGDRSTLDQTQLKEYLLHHLPGYMIPAYFIRMKQMPLTPNGKIDLKALPNPEGTRPQLKQTYIAPKTDLEKTIANVWTEVLKLDTPGVYDNFFDLGGNSLDIVMVAGKLKQAIKQEIPLVELFANPTIKTLTQHLTQETSRDRLTERKTQHLQQLEKARNKMKASISKTGKKVK